MTQPRGALRRWGAALVDGGRLLAIRVFREAQVSTLRGNLVIFGSMLLLSTTGVWRYMASSFDAHDMRRAVAHGSAPNAPAVVVIGIDDQGYSRYFGGRSPLDQGRLAALLQALDAAAPTAGTIVVDLDLTPLPGEDRAALFAVFKRAPARWVLADVPAGQADGAAGRAAWRAALCTLGVRLASPLVPTTFGYASTSTQYAGSMADVALHPAASACHQNAAQVTAAATPPAIAWASSPHALSAGWVVPFQGDIKSARDAVEQLAPPWIVVGGMWGSGDMFNTPMGLRYGLQLHAAAIDGAVQHQRIAPQIAQFAAAWVGVAAMTLGFALIQMLLKQHIDPWTPAMKGLAFMRQSALPLAVIAYVFAGLIALSEVLAWITTHTGVWMPTSRVAAVVIVRVLLDWNWGVSPQVIDRSKNAAWRRTVLDPIRNDGQAIGFASRRLWALVRGRQPLPETEASPPIGAVRAALDLLMVCLSLVVQTVFPLFTAAVLVQDLLLWLR